MSKFLFRVSDLMKIECRNAMLLEDMNISRFMTHSQQVEDDKLREMTKDNKKARTRKFRQDQNGRTSGSKSQGSASGNKTFPTCPKCGKNHLGDCLAGKEGCFGCGQSGHRLKNFLSSRYGQGGNNNRAQSTTPAAPAGRLTQQGASSDSVGSQHQNRLYALQDRQD
ncbi:uncharacterized protein LOC125837803 [Solanum verrucosum]|uniref:uncharacterized protein LOC125837803 n=1 Tax=Solanum verrucosum TaxID=315347 RepID=UPI0020D010E1|nr:uncharacterized protein LOC125837803 [Solanum verrucosum]